MNGHDNALVARGKGLLAMDESNGTCNKCFASAGIPQTEEARRAYRELIVTTPGLGEVDQRSPSSMRHQQASGVQAMYGRHERFRPLPGIGETNGRCPARQKF